MFCAIFLYKKNSLRKQGEKCDLGILEKPKASSKIKVVSVLIPVGNGIVDHNEKYGKYEIFVFLCPTVD